MMADATKVQTNTQQQSKASNKIETFLREQSNQHFIGKQMKMINNSS
jgi:hypothetical protein